MGKKYTKADVSEIQEACRNLSVSWLTAAQEEKKPKFGVSTPNPKAALADAEEIKALSKKLKEEGKLGSEGEFHY